MKIAFRIDSLAKNGMGHFVRMSALADAFSESGVACHFFYGEDEPIDYSRFDIIIVDSYLLSDADLDALSTQSRFVVFYDDNALYPYSCDVLLNANLHAEELTFRFGLKRPTMLLGGEYALLRREFWDAKPIDIKPVAQKILVTFGGADVNNFTPIAIRALQKIPEAELVVVLGSVTENEEDVRGAATGENITIHKNPPSMRSVMQDCDIAISAGGSTVYELAVLGIPTLIVTQADNQELLAAWLSKHGLMKSLGTWRNCSLELLREETEKLLYDKTKRKSIAERLTHMVNPKGALQAAKLILELAG